MDFSGCADDASLGPSVHGCRGGFDLTIKFEKAIFSILPSSIFTAIALPTVVILLRKPQIVTGAWFQFTKAGILAVALALRFALLGLSANATFLRNYFVAGAALDAVATLCMAALSFVDHARSPRPSILLNLYLPVKLLLDIAQTRTLWLASRSHSDEVFSQLFTAATALLAASMVLEAIRKRSWLQWDMSTRSPEETVGLYELAACTWMFRLLRAGYSKILAAEDLNNLNYELSAEGLRVHVEALKVSEFRGKKYGLAKALFKTLAIPLLMPVVPLICQVGLGLAQPLLLQSLLGYLAAPDQDNNNGYGLIGATILIYFSQPLVTSIASYFQVRSLFMMRSVLVAVVYRKTTTSLCSASSDGKAVTLMGTDVERIRSGLIGMHELWWVPLQVGVTCWLLYRQLGAAFLAPIVLIIVLTISTSLIMRWVTPRTNAWMEKTESRVGKTSNVISNMKNIKISGLTRAVEHSIQRMRVGELNTAAKLWLVELVVVAAGFAPGALSAMFTFAVTARTLDVQSIFTSLALLELLSGPMNGLFQSAPAIVSALACIQRVQSFLEAKDRQDFRQIPKNENASGPGSTDPSAADAPVIEVEDGSFGWEEDRMVLKNVNLSVMPGLNIVVGPVASGKSTLCKTLLGETPFAKGRVSFAINRDKVGYCDQVPFLFNATIKENIVGFGDFDQDRYEKAIHATMLQPDLEVFPHGDQTKVGSNGITLSGGQKQRVSIARAVYEECDLYVFDDILSGLDTDTEKHVFKHVFGTSGLLQQRRATVVLCTHAVHYVSRAAHIIGLGTDGSVVEQGSFRDLLANKKYIHSLGVSEVEVKLDSDIDTPPSELQPSSLAVKSIPRKPEDDEKDMKRSSGDFGVFSYYYKSVGHVRGIFFFLASVVCGFCVVFPNAWLAWWSNDAASAHPKHSKPYYMGIYALLSCLRWLSILVQIGTGWMVVGRMAGRVLHKNALRTLIAAPLRFFVKTDVGIVTNLFSQDITLIDNELTLSLLNTVAMFWIVVAAAAMAASASPYVLIVYPFLAAAAYFLQRFYLKTSRQLRFLDLEAKSPLYTHFIDTMKGLATYRAFRWTDEALAKNSKLLDHSTNPAFQLGMIQRWLGSTLKFLMAFIATAIVALATQLRSSSSFTGASMVSLITFSAFLAALISNYTLLETSLGAVNRLREFGSKTETEDLPGEDTIPDVSWPEKGAIEIRAVSTSYDYSPSASSTVLEKGGEDPVLVLRDLDLTIKAGQKVAVCGRTGSGKSSFLLMLLRLLDPYPNAKLNLSIDGVSLIEVERETLRQRIIAVPQEPVFLPDGTSFKLNLDPGHVATDAECQAALEAVDLWSFVTERDGLDGNLSADMFSQGQKQLFSLARTILRRRVRLRQRTPEHEKQAAGRADPSDDGGVLILDEYSSSLDIATDKLMQQIILREFKNYTVVMVSHRLDMVMEFDKVVVLDTGRIIETGAPKELAEQDGSRFKELWSMRNTD